MSENPVEPIRQKTEASSTSGLAIPATRKAPVLGILLLTTLLGCLVPYLVVQYQQNSYQKFFSPPEKATEIMAENFGGLNIRTAEGKVFLCGVQRDGSTLKPSLCTEVTSENVARDSRPDQIPCSNLPPAPGKVIASYEDCGRLPDGSTSTRWVILEDGSVWRWHLTCAMFGCGASAISPMLFGAIGGMIAGLIIAVVIGMRSARQPGLSAAAKASDAPREEVEAE